ncbi:MAG TPA: hypothetical protein VMZ25_08425 [Terriglobales bacterium]|nr:hypothetical protein [Terriglobales bacterium]
MRRLQSILLAVSLAAFLAGCNQQRGSEQKQSTGPDTIQQPAGSADKRASAPDVDDLELGRSVDANKKVTDGVDDFNPTDTIYLSVKTDGAAANSEVKVRWTYQNGQLVKEDKRNIPAGGDAWTEFHISKPGGFPKGDYKVIAYVNGAEKGSKTFEVK